MEMWKGFESYLAELFNLDRTITSGNRFFDPGDAVSRGRQDPWPLYIEAKTTEKRSFRLNLQDLGASVLTAGTLGKRFIMPIRFWSRRSMVQTEDYVLLTLLDFKELLDLARGAMPESNSL